MTYTLPDHVEDLTLTGTAQQGRGNSNNNRITGNSQANVLAGGGGEDIFVFNSPLNGQVDVIEDFGPDDKIELSRAIFTGIDETRVLDYIVYDKATGHLSYDPDGQGRADLIHFATLPTGLNFSAHQVIFKGEVTSPSTLPTAPTLPTQPTPPTQPVTPDVESLTLNPLTADDHLNVTEAGRSHLTISGQASGGNQVQVTIGDQVLTAPVVNGQYELDVETSTLLTNASHEIQVKLGDLSKSRTYTVDPLALAQLEITGLEEQVGELVRISGRVDPKGTDFEKFRNLTRLEELSLTLNDKTYSVGVNSQGRFNLEISRADLEKAKGQSFTVSHKNQPWLYDLTTNGSSTTLKPIPLIQGVSLLTADHVILDENDYIQNGKVVENLPELTTRITGQARGAKAHDQVTLRIGEKVVTTQLDSQGRFSVDVANSAVKANASGKISAELSTRASNEQAVTVRADYHYATPRQLDGTFVTTFDKSQNVLENMPYFLQALIGEDIKMNGHLAHDPMDYTKTHTLTYSFNTDRDGDVAIDQENRSGLRKAFDNLSQYANVVFKQVADNTRSEAEVRDKNKGKADSEMVWSDIIYHYSTTEGTNRGYYGGPVIFSARNQLKWTDPERQYLLYHETFHSLGAMHAHDEGFVGKVVLPPLEDQNGLSIMTYRPARINSDKTNIRLYDLIYLHFRYGVNPTNRADNDVYSFKDFDMHQVDGNIYVWDGAGVDTFDASMENDRVVVDLTPGSWIYRGAKTDTFVVKAFEKLNAQNFFEQPNLTIPNAPVYFKHDLEHVHEFQTGQAFIGYGTQLERLIGSRFDDELKGNVAANDIYGGAGADTISGGAGDDYLDGGAGDDTFIVDDKADIVNEAAGQGHDHIIASVDYILSDHVEDLTLTGTAQQGRGNSNNNRITGNSQANVLAGGGGEDTFVFNSPLNGQVDVIEDFGSDDKIELSRNIFTGIDATRILDFIIYDKTTGHLSYDSDGKSGQADAIHFATLPKDLTFTADQIIWSK